MPKISTMVARLASVGRIYVDTHFLLATSIGGTGSIENGEVTPVILGTNMK
jgi:hypothetical protein